MASGFRDALMFDVTRLNASNILWDESLRNFFTHTFPTTARLLFVVFLRMQISLIGV